jgi:hypothetical protein
MSSLSKSARYYRRNKKARDVKDKYNTKYHKAPARRKYRANLNKARRKRGLKGDPRDLSHKKDGTLVLEGKKSNRARNGADGKSSKK